ncbi:MAG: archease [Candidatus Pacebacteria bacterium]|nr:archease [Candidatus Paceibacterota bacterium]
MQKMQGRVLHNYARPGLARFEILPHPADLKIRAFGKDKKELFEAALFGMFKGANYQGKGKDIKREIKISSQDLPSLLIDFLSELLYLAEINQEVYYKISFKKFNNKNIEGILTGKKLKRIGVIIKGVTWHDLKIQQRKDGTWVATNYII